jgi:ribosomal protein S18 acetylase RimI-like enzyme
MREEDIPDYNIFMSCEKLNENALTLLSQAYYLRNCRPDELELWKAFPFDSQKVPTQYQAFMNQFVEEVYSKNLDLFFENTLLVCTQEDKAIATCSHWKAYGKIHTIHWLKTLKAYEGRGIGRALLSAIMRRFDQTAYPIYLHTQPGSFRAVKLYSDFGFQLLSGGQLGTRTNELEKCLPMLREFMPENDFQKLVIRDTPNSLIEELKNETTIQF